MSYDLIKIKEKYGEKMMHLCRTLFPTLLENEGKLFKLLESNFAYSKFLYDDIIKNKLEDEFKNYIYSKIDMEKNKIIINKTPEELLSEVGYNLYECKTEEDIQSFKKYYSKGEGLCTFNGGRLERCHVFFAVKNNVDEIKRENFKTPGRQDEYGTSVISIQFTKGDVNTLSIKNRYNHRVNNPDATFSNNLENIISGLTESFERKYNLNINQNDYDEFDLPGYVKANDGKFYKYNYEINNIYYCPNNIIIDNFEVINDYQEKEKYLIIDYFVIDLVNKTVSLYDKSVDDSFPDYLNDISKIEIVKEKETNTKTLKITFCYGSDVFIKIRKDNVMVSYTDDHLKVIGDNFLYSNDFLEEINLPNVLKIGSDFLLTNKFIKYINFPKLVEIKDYFLYYNRIIDKLNLPNVISIGNHFLEKNCCLESIELPSLVQVGSDFLYNNKILEKLTAPYLTNVGSSFLHDNKSLKNIELLSLEKVGDLFIRNNELLNIVKLPKLKQVGNQFLYSNKSLKVLDLPQLICVGAYFLADNNSLVEFNAENLETILKDFLVYNECLENINIPKVKTIGSGFLFNNKSLTNLILPELLRVGGSFLYMNNSLINFSAPKLYHVGGNFLFCNTTLENMDTPLLKELGTDFCYNNKIIRQKVLKQY